MMITVRFLGLELLHLEVSTDEQQSDEPGDCVTTPVGFTASYGDQRWESSPDLA